ncbi:LacI family DNA-binding transcriptional regulator [Lacrimispora sp.]|uniref:LacI family DNA-binding transcriptional regulator n=1 Tax=Lacrimispora sp. TaxID=2719234 RepID=UPI002897129E|nr:LacI family DNA-binding transcriptional regulator [Lacrimispora sp.]
MSTLKDVAEKAGVTVTTASRVINNRGYLSEETKHKVKQAMEELHYRPNELARSLSKQVTSTIGVITPHIAHPYFAQLISQLENAATKRGFKILLCNSKEDHSLEAEYIDLCKSNRVAGIIFCGMILASEQYSQKGFPFVAIECNSPLCVSTILCDNYAGGRLAAEHLIECGCKNLIHFSGIIDQEMPGDSRAQAFTDVCKHYKVTFNNIWTGDSTYYTMDYHEFIKQTLLTYPDTDGIFASSDLIAAQVIQVCAEIGKKIPDDIQLIGFDDVALSTLTTPQISTIHQPTKEMAEMAVESLIKSSGQETVPNKIVLPVSLVKRQSTRK